MAPEQQEVNLDELPPGAYLFVALLVVWFMPKDDLYGGEFTEVSSVVVIGAILLSILILAVFVYLSYRRGVQIGVKWLVIDGIYLPNSKDKSTKKAQQPIDESTSEGVVDESDPGFVDESVETSESEIIEHLCKNLTGHEFEEFVAELWERRGWDTEVTRGSADGGVDVIAEHDMVTGKDRRNTEKIQAKLKRDGSRLGPRPVRELAGSERVNQRDNLVVVTTTDFTSNAKDVAESKAVELVGKDKLKNMIQENMGDTKWA
jgi:hypothetical protein